MFTMPALLWFEIVGQANRRTTKLSLVEQLHKDCIVYFDRRFIDSTAECWTIVGNLLRPNWGESRPKGLGR